MTPLRLRASRAVVVATALAAAPLLGSPLAGRPLGAQTPTQPAAPLVVEVRDVGPGEAGRLLRDVLAKPHLVLQPGVETLALPRDSVIDRTIVVVGSDVTVASQVAGDVVVVGGDLFIHPGANVAGRAIAYGGGVYDSRLASVQGGLFAFRDETFTVVREASVLALAYRRLDTRPRATFALPGLYGLRLPTYTRVDGLVVPVGAAILLPRLDVEIDAVATYRSHLGTVDPSIAARRALDRRTDLELVAERATYTNDAWLRGDLVNSGTTIVFGDDERNYYRAVRFGGRIARRWEGMAGLLEPWVGVRTEDARSVGPTRGAASEPWSIFGGDDTTRMLRPNPAVLDGRITSALVGARGEWIADAMTGRGAAWIEAPLESVGDRRFVQFTADATTDFATVRDHRLELAAHVVLTVGDTAPPQRFAYLGGGGSIPTLRELSLGGDQLLFLEGTYLVPLPKPVLPLVGAPTIGVRYIVGSAGVQRLPAFSQNVGLRLILMPFTIDLLVDPATGDVDFGFRGTAAFF